MIEREKALRLIIRQVKDIQAQADKILSGDNSEESIETFSRYLDELRDFIHTHIEVQEIRSYLSELPEIEYAPKTIQLWQYLVFPAWWVAMYHDHVARNEAVRDVSIARGKFATLELMIKGIT